MLKVFNFLLLNKYSILFTSCVKFSQQYLGYYAKYSFFNLKGSKSEVTKIRNKAQNNLKKSAFQLGNFNFICHAEQ